MSPSKNKLFLIVKWLVMITAYGFLIYKLANFEYWDELKKSFQDIQPVRILYLLLVILLLPVNWWLEAVKWQKLMSNSLRISNRNAIKSVLAGISTGYITPNRIGEFAGRVLFLPGAHRATGVIMSLINSLTQNIVVAVIGIFGAVVFYAQRTEQDGISNSLFWIGLVVFVAVITYFSLPFWIQKIKPGKWSERAKEVFLAISKLKTSDLFWIVLISVLRYLVFCTQYFLMLRFFQIDISALQAVYAIPAMYLLVTFTPSLAASEPAIRSSYAVLIFSAFSSNTVGIMLTGILIWLINFVVPMVVGTILVGKVKEI